MSASVFNRSREKRSHHYAPLKRTDASDAQDVLQASHQSSQTLSPLTQHFLTFSAGVLLTSILFLLFGSPSAPLSIARTHTANLASANSPVPTLPLTTVTFKKNETFTARPSLKTDRAWNALLPPGRGFVFIQNPEQYDLQPGQWTKDGPIYSVSLFHQLHCLGELRKAYWTLIQGVETGDTRPSRKLLGDGGGHITHCFDYLRQGIMCAGDMSMEWPRTEPDGERFAVDGWDIPHQCKSWDAISDYMAKARFNNSMNSEIAPS